LAALLHSLFIRATSSEGTDFQSLHPVTINSHISHRLYPALILEKGKVTWCVLGSSTA